MNFILFLGNKFNVGWEACQFTKNCGYIFGMVSDLDDELADIKTYPPLLGKNWKIIGKFWWDDAMW